MRLACSTYTFFEHDSFVDCSNVIEDLSESEIIRQLGEDAARIKGQLNKSDLSSVIEIVQAARTISPINKEIIISSLKRCGLPSNE